MMAAKGVHNAISRSHVDAHDGSLDGCLDRALRRRFTRDGRAEWLVPAVLQDRERIGGVHSYTREVIGCA